MAQATKSYANVDRAIKQDVYKTLPCGKEVGYEYKGISLHVKICKICSLARKSEDQQRFGDVNSGFHDIMTKSYDVVCGKRSTTRHTTPTELVYYKE